MGIQRMRVSCKRGVIYFVFALLSALHHQYECTANDVNANSVTPPAGMNFCRHQCVGNEKNNDRQ